MIRTSRFSIEGDRARFTAALSKPYTLNLIVAELIVVTGIVAGMFLTWPDVPWNALKWTLLPLAVLAPLATLPFARSVWLAIDLRFRPPEQSDFVSS